ncbi:MAG: peptidase [Lysobacteraceae bacterium]|nr:MAG: peptidase [Xanthomonadaceae bacterium]
MVTHLLIVFATLLAADSDSLQLKGDLIQGGLVIGQTHPDAQVQLNGKDVPVAPSGRIVFGFGRDAAPIATLSIEHDGVQQTQQLEIAQRSYPTERVDGLPQETVTPSQQSIERIQREGAMVANARGLKDWREDFAEGFVLPAQGRISGVYGSRRILNGEPKRPHYGLDVAAKTGTEVRAPAAGVVRLTHQMLLSGGTLIIDHGMGVTSTFIHLSAFEVAVGDRVEQGDLIARVGATGRASGPHLDWRVNWLSERLDPGLLVNLPQDQVD